MPFKYLHSELLLSWGELLPSTLIQGLKFDWENPLKLLNSHLKSRQSFHAKNLFHSAKYNFN